VDTSSTDRAKTSTSTVAHHTPTDYPFVSDPALYAQTCTELRATQDLTGVRPGTPETDLRAFIRVQEQTPWWAALGTDLQDTYVRAARDFAAGKC
jgi:hypothetical protein